MKEESLVQKGELSEETLICLLDTVTRRYIEQSLELERLRELSFRNLFHAKPIKKPWWRFWE